MSYIVFAVPTLLSTIGAPFLSVAFGACLVAAVASICAGYFANVPAAIAPGMAIVGIVTSFVSSNSNANLTWEGALLCCSIAGLLFFIMSVEGFRTRLINSLPKPIIFAISGGIGALLADKALEISGLVSEQSASSAEKLAFTAGLIVIVVGFIVIRTIAVRLASKPHFFWFTRYLDLIGRSSLLISVVVAALTAEWSDLAVKEPESTDGVFFAFSNSNLSAADVLGQMLSPEAAVLLLTILYVLLADFVGSPYQLLMKSGKNTFTKRESKTIEESFRIDSFANIWAPLFGVTSAVYYAENNAGKVAGGKSGLTAITVGLCFAILAAALIFLSALGFRIQNFIPAISVAPVLFFVGIYIVASSLVPYSEETLPGDFGNTETDSDLFVERRIPAALTIILTPVLSFEYAIASGLAVYYFYFVIFTDKYEHEFAGERSKERREGDVMTRGSLAYLHFLTLLAMIALFVKVMTVN